MSNLFSAFGFNQPFLIALAAIIIMLLVTAVFVGSDEPQKSNVTHQHDDIATPCIRIHNPLLLDTTTRRYQAGPLAPLLTSRNEISSKQSSKQ
ncbi:hypothetical protein ACH3XW_31960 [Acanthocheilonema viteae]